MTDLDLLALRRHARRLLAPWDAPGLPGCTLGLVRDGALVLHENAGLASLELGVPIGAETCFRIASVSKQFTCAAILLLASEGKLAVGDDIRAHLPELPDFGARISIDQLMHNCSGLRDMLELMRMGGADLAQPCTAEDLLTAIRRQRGLNFAPGSRFLYSNTNFFLLGRIVEAVSGEPLGEFLTRRIFAPLGMTRTRHTPSTVEVVPGLATGYLPRPEGGFTRAAHGFALGGEGGLVSCLEDLALWDRNFSTGRVGGTALAAALAKQTPFSNGHLNKYARGLEVTTYRGLRTVDHGGLWPGYKTCFLRVPDCGLTVITIANHGGIDAHLLAHRLLDAVVEGRPEVHPLPALPQRAALEDLAGRWLEPESGTTVEFRLNQAGEPEAVQHGVPFALAPTEDGRLAARRGVFEFIAALPEGERLAIETDAGTVTMFHRAPTDPALPPDLAGHYRCEELATEWRIGTEGEGLAVWVRGPLLAAGPWRLEAVAADAVRVHTPGALFQGWLDARLLRDATGGITGLAVSGARARELRFERLG